MGQAGLPPHGKRKGVLAKGWLREQGCGRTETHTTSTPHEHSQECAHHIEELQQSDHAHQSLPIQSKKTTFNDFHCQISLHNRVNNFCQKFHLPQFQLPRTASGTATSPAVTHLSTSDPLITMPRPHRPSFWALPSLHPLIAFHFLFIFSYITNFSRFLSSSPFNRGYCSSPLREQSLLHGADLPFGSVFHLEFSMSM